MTKINTYKWHFVDSKRIPRWVKKRFDFSGENPMDGVIEERIQKLKGKHYEWQLVVVAHYHTHDNAILRRKINKHKKHHIKSHAKRSSLWAFIKKIF